MQTRFIVVLCLMSLTAPFAVGQASQGAAFDPQATGRKYTRDFYQREIESLWPHFGDAMKKALGTADNLKMFREQVDQQLGDEASVIRESVTKSGDIRSYVRHARFAKLPQVIEVVWAFDPQGMVEGFSIRPVQKEADSPHIDYQTKADLSLPFEGVWHVFWGGRTLAENYHAYTQDQRFAYDLLIMKDGATHTGDGKSNDQYHCFGKPITAPGAGVVTAAVDGIADNIPGVMNPKQAVGNHVIIDHGNGEFSFMAHFQQGTVKVKTGDKLKSGDLLGLCGNSGNSSEPHLHYHLQTTPTYREGEGLPAQFQNYLADGKPVQRGEPSKGQSIERKR